MFGLGSAEAGLILIAVLVLFAPTVVAFLAGYAMGQRRGTAAPPTDLTASSDSAPAPGETVAGTSGPGFAEGEDAADE